MGGWGSAHEWGVKARGCLVSWLGARWRLGELVGHAVQGLDKQGTGANEWVGLGEWRVRGLGELVGGKRERPYILVV